MWESYYFCLHFLEFGLQTTLFQEKKYYKSLFSENRGGWIINESIEFHSNKQSGKQKWWQAGVYSSSPSEVFLGKGVLEIRS